MGRSSKRLEAAAMVVESVKGAYPDAKKITIDIHFEWQKAHTFGQDDELCPVVNIQIER